MSQDIPRGAPGMKPGAPTPVPAGTLRLGMCVFFTKCKKSAFRKAQEFSFKGQAYGILLGVLPQFAKDPTREQLVAAMAGVGFVLLDDVADFLGDENAQKFTDKFHEKYEGKPGENPAAVDGEPEKPELVVPEPPRLLGPNGKPL